MCSTPVQSLGPVTYMSMRHEDVYMLCITKSNVNAMMAFQFMRSVSSILLNCFPLCQSQRSCVGVWLPRGECVTLFKRLCTHTSNTICCPATSVGGPVQDLLWRQAVREQCAQQLCVNVSFRIASFLVLAPARVSYI